MICRCSIGTREPFQFGTKLLSVPEFSEPSRRSSDKEVQAAFVRWCPRACSPDLPARISLRELASCCPTIYSEAAELGIELRVACPTLEYTQNLDAKTNTIDLIIHPTIPNVLDEIWEHITFSPRCVEHVQPKDFRAGGGFSL